MGQYYTAVTTNKNGVTTAYNNRTALITQEDKDGFAMDSYYNYHGLKIMEHSWWKNDLVNGIAKKLVNNPQRVAWVGDYSDESTHTASDGVETPLTLPELYSLKDVDSDISKAVKGNKNFKRCMKVRYTPDWTMDNYYLVNLSRKEYVDCNAYFKRSVDNDGDWCVHPLPLLTSTGGDRGGGDYHEGLIDADKVGRWAYDLITLVKRKPSDDFTRLDVTFNESIKDTKSLSLV